MTPWRAEQLWQLYLMVYNELTRELEIRAHREPFPPARPSASNFCRASRRATCAPTPKPRSTSTWRWRRSSRKRGVAVEVRRLESAWQLTLIAHGPSRPVRVGGRNAVQLRHEHSEGGGLLQPPRPGARHVHIRRSDSHAGPESRAKWTGCGRPWRKVIAGKTDVQRAARATVPSPRCPAARRGFAASVVSIPTPATPRR